MTDTTARPMPDGLANNLVLEAELRRVARAFAKAEIDLVVLKGIPFARRLSRSLPARALADNDLLVRPADTLRAYEIMRNLGYTLGQPQVALEDRIHETHESVLVGTRHGHRVVADLHWGLVPDFLREPPEHLIWEATEIVELQGVPVRVLGRSTALVNLALHFAQHGFGLAHAVEDFALAWNAWGPAIDIDDLLRTADAFHALAALDYSFRVAQSRHLVTTPPPLIGSWRAALLHGRHPEGRTPGSTHDYAGLVVGATFGTPRRALRTVFRAAVPTKQTMLIANDSPTGPRLVIHYLGRPFRPIRHAAIRRRRH